MTRSFRALGVLLVPALLFTGLTGCGADEKPVANSKPKTNLPTGDVDVPKGLTLTEPGTELVYGQTATVAYEPNTTRNTVLSLQVTRVNRGDIKDLAAYDLEPRTKLSTPFYVQVTVKNVGDGDVGRTAIPLWALDQSDTLIQSSSFLNNFPKCQSGPLPTTFAPNAVVNACLLYLVPSGGQLKGISFRSLQDTKAITWSAPVKPTPAPTKPAAPGTVAPSPAS